MPSGVVVYPSSLQFNSASGSAQTTVSEIDYSGAFDVSATTCDGIASETQSGNTFTITPLKAGSCSYTISDAHDNSAKLSIGVTTSSGTIQVRLAW